MEWSTFMPFPELPIALSHDGPLHVGIYDAIRGAILDGRLRPGAKLPSTRQFADQLAVARGTVVVAFEQLHAEGYVVSERGSGTFVSRTLPDAYFRAAGAGRAAPKRTARARLSARGRALGSPFPVLDTPPLRPFHPYAPALDLFRHDLFAQLVARRARNPSRALVLGGDARGYEPLRAALAEHLRVARAVSFPAERIFIVSSVQQALSIAAFVVTDPGDAAWVEEPGYAGASAALRAAGARVVPVPIDAHGLDVARGQRLAPAPRLVYVTPAHQSPLGMAMSLERRMELLNACHASGAWIFEDDYDCEFRYEGRPLGSLSSLDRDDVVIHAGSFSKILYPALRLAYVAVPDSLASAFASAKAALDRFTAPLLQAALADFIAEGHFARHLRRAREVYRERRATLVQALRDELDDNAEIMGARAGLDLVVALRRRNDVALAAALMKESIEAVALSSWYTTAPRKSGLILGFAPFTPAQLRKAAATLGHVYRMSRATSAR